MDAPFEGTSQGYAGVSDVLNPITSNNIFESSSFDDPNWDLLEEICPNFQFSDNYLDNNVLFDSSFACTPSAPAQSECKLQPRVYNGSVSIACTYTPPPSCQVLHLQHLQPGEWAASIITPPHTPIADVVSPVIMQCSPPPADVLHPAHIYMPLHAGDMPLHANVGASNMPPPYQFGADPNLMYCTGSQSHDCNFSFSHVEASHKNQLPHDAFHGRSKLTSSVHHENIPQKWGLPRVDVPTSPIVCGNGGTPSPAYMQSSTFSMGATISDCLAMEISSMSAPAAPATSNSSFYRASTPSERASLTVPPSPTPSVNKGLSTKKSSHCRSTVAFNVKTDSLTLPDGFIWKKYGEKRIMRHKFPRGYFRCNETERCGCKVLKRIQKSNDEDYVLFTYVGRHNHQ